MEISLVSHELFPDDAMISIRAGAVRRQAALDSQKPFRFSQSFSESNPVKIDVLKPAGSAYLVLKPGQENYKVTFGSGMKAEVNVSHSNGNKGAAVVEGRGLNPHGAAQEGKDYLERHQVLPLLQAVVQALLREQPSDPFVYIARHLLNGYLPDSFVDKASVKSGETNTEQDQKSTADPIESASIHREDSSVPCAARKAEETAAADDHAAPMADLKSADKGASDSRLHDAGDDTLEEGLVKASAPGEEAETSIEANGVAHAIHIDSLGEQQVAAESSLNAQPDGALEKDVGIVMPHSTTEGRRDAPVNRRIDILQQKAANSLLRAAEDGALESAVAKARLIIAESDSPTCLRRKAALALLQAAENGDLAKSLVRAAGKEPP